MRAEGKGKAACLTGERTRRGGGTGRVGEFGIDDGLVREIMGEI